MHGRLKVKTTKEQEEEQKIKDREKAYHFRHLTDRLFELRASIKTGENLDSIFKLTTELLLLNPDFYTVWNIRKESILKHVEQQIAQGLTEDEVDTIWKDELNFTIDCLKKNEKSYSVWQHRIWCLSHMNNSLYDAEILLCNTFLAKDERNFHCWDYRSYISDISNADIESELEFTTKKIHSNFSNFSAWHRRHKLLLKALKLPEDSRPPACDLTKIWASEYEMVLNALFTDPSDQSPWLYHNWLIKNNCNQFSEDHLSKLVTLEELEPDNKWVKQALKLANDVIAK